MSNLLLESRLAGALCAVLGASSGWAAETVALSGTVSQSGKVIVVSESVLEIMVGNVLKHPLLAGAFVVLGVALVLYMLRQRQLADEAPDSPEPPAVPSAWPKAFKPQPAAGQFSRHAATEAVARPRTFPPEADTKPISREKQIRAGKGPVEIESISTASGGMTFEWPGAANDGDLKDPAPMVGRQRNTKVPPVAEHPAIALNSLQLRLRDRYIGVRFPGVAKSSQDLEASGQVIKAARLYFEDDQPRRAVELLELAIEQHPEEEALWLALIEILFLIRMRNDYCKVAARFKVQHPASNQWEEVARLGAVIAGDNLMFRAAAGGPRAHEHYGPWPDLPNWIQAPWDLTAEVSAADFHARMTQRLAARRSAAAPLTALAKAA